MSKSGVSSLKFHQYILGLLSAILGPSQIYTSSPQTVHMLFFMFETLSIIAFLKLWRVVIQIRPNWNYNASGKGEKIIIIKKIYSMEPCKDSKLNNTNWML